MCGRFALWSTTGKEKISGFKPSYNISPQMTTPVFVKESPKKIKLMKWGIGDLIINARSEGIEEKLMFRNLIREKRCLILANGFFEWKKLNLEGKEEKIPWFIGLKKFPVFCMAGIYDSSESYVIITTSANKVLEDIHHRMPVIIEKNMEDVWLDKGSDIVSILDMLKPYADFGMVSYPVSKKVNNPDNDYPSLIEKVK